MAIGDDFTIDYVNKRIYHSTSATTVWTVNALYSYLQDTFDELDQMDDPIPMSAQTPTEYSLINGWFMNEAREGTPQKRGSFEYLKTGAIKTDGQNAIIQIVPFGATYTNAVAADIGEMVTDDTADTGNLLDYDNTNKKWWVRWGTAIANGSVMAITGGTGAGTTNAASTTGEQLWPNIYTLGTIEQHTDEEQIYIEQNLSRVFSGSEWWPESKTTATTRHVDVLIKTKESNSEIDNGNITVYLRNYPDSGNADLYDHFGIDLTAGGRNAVPLATSPDLNNTTAATVVSGYSGISVAFVNGTLTYSAISGTFSEFEVVTQATSNASGLFLKQTTGTGAGTMTLANVVGSFGSVYTITGGTSTKTAAGSSGLTNAYRMVKQFEQQATSPEYSVIIGCNSFTLAGMYQYLKYVTRIGSTFTMYPTGYPQGGPVSRTTKEGQLYIRAHEDTQTSPTNTFSPVKASPFGTFAGGKFFGAQGVWIQNMATSDIQNFQLIDADGTTQTPPNKQAVTITNLISGDRVSVFRTVSATDSSINKAMYTAASGNTSGNTSFIVTEAIAVDTPSSGSIRTVDTSDTTATRETRYTYTSWVTSTFSGLSPALDRTYTLTDDKAYVPFIDISATQTSASVTVIYNTDRSIILRVRRKAATAILPFETTGTFISSGYSTSAIRTTDTIVT